ncbi:PadR family transcriptional regulator [Aestuariibacter halophilus]|uniref:PadR family transcriptional regulator n=1 Tax=Fluctibacter halophilus TaxID=226011 RepID=A0ABS8G646_9ALTE|nr:PadR family transcriptional regulator [Aestuariibacter halophilus]MCC2616062.1 PadR family transcriptional regulator [Aestuariibacter halophilus]
MTNKIHHINDADMLEQQAKKFQKELNAGTVALMLLAVISRSKAPMYGYEIAKALQQEKNAKQGAIYPVLRNLHARGLLECEVKLSASGPPRKYFSISPLGQKVFEQWLRTWRATQEQVNNIVGLSENND